MPRDILGEQAFLIGGPILLAFCVFRQNGDGGFPKQDFAGEAVGADVLDGAREEAEPLGAQGRDRLIDYVEYGGRRAKAAFERQVVEDMVGIFRIALERYLRGGERLRAGALKTEDRLLEIADGEDGADAIALGPLPCEKFGGERADDLPLADVRVLRLIDHDVVDTLVQLVANPVCDAGLGQKIGGAGDEVVEIHGTGELLRLLIGAGVGASCM